MLGGSAGSAEGGCLACTAAGNGAKFSSAGPGGAGAGGADTGTGSGGGGGGAGYFGGGGGGGSNVNDAGGGGGGSDFCAISLTAPASLSGCGVIGSNSTFGTASVGLTYAVASPPSASIKTPADGATYPLGQVVDSSFTCTEGVGGTGIASCVDQNGHPSGSAIDTSTAGSHTYTVNATSRDGLTGRASITYSVTAPRVSVRASRIRVVHGKGRLRLGCSGAVTCRGTLTLKLHGRIAAMAHYSASDSHTRTIVINLRKKALKLLAEAPNHRLTGVLHVKVVSGQSVSRRVMVILDS
jgi:hypothetical protein